MGFLRGLRGLARAFTTEGSILTGAYAYQAKFPHLGFMEALERSLTECRPGWSMAVWDEVASRLRGFPEDAHAAIAHEVAMVESEWRSLSRYTRPGGKT